MHTERSEADGCEVKITFHVTGIHAKLIILKAEIEKGDERKRDSNKYFNRSWTLELMIKKPNVSAFAKVHLLGILYLKPVQRFLCVYIFLFNIKFQFFNTCV